MKLNEKERQAVEKKIKKHNMAKIISITGDLGSGKSTVSDIICKRLNYEYIYTGKIYREIANKYNMTPLELNQYSETHPNIDEEIDSTFKSLNEATHLIVDSRLAWFFIPISFKVFLKTNLIVSVNRISNDTQRADERYSSKEEAANKIMARSRVKINDIWNFTVQIVLIYPTSTLLLTPRSLLLKELQTL